MLVNAFTLAERARFFENNGARFRTDRLRETLDRQNCCTECGTRLVFEEDFYQEHGYYMCPICDGYRDYN
jgi:hypothetical protein